MTLLFPLRTFAPLVYSLAAESRNTFICVSTNYTVENMTRRKRSMWRGRKGETFGKYLCVNGNNLLCVLLFLRCVCGCGGVRDREREGGGSERKGEGGRETARVPAHYWEVGLLHLLWKLPHGALPGVLPWNVLFVSRCGCVFIGRGICVRKRA